MIRWTAKSSQGKNVLLIGMSRKMSVVYGCISCLLVVDWFSIGVFIFKTLLKLSQTYPKHVPKPSQTSPKHPKKTPKHVPKTSPKPPENIPKSQNIPQTSPIHSPNLPKTSPKHPQTFPKPAQNIPKTFPKHVFYKVLYVCPSRCMVGFPF